MVVELLGRVGLSGFQLYLNSVGDANCRPQYVALLTERLREVKSRLCEDCQRRAETNPLRVLDCKVPEDQPIIDTLPSIQDHLCEPCRTHFDTVRAQLDDRGIPYEVRPRMVRGLDYYMRTTFEITHGSLGAQNSVLGGGRYDGLAEALGSKVHSPGIGFSIGEDRLVMSVEQERPDEFRSALDVYLAPMGAASERHCAQLARDLRSAGLAVELGLDSKLKRSLELANKMAARFVLIVGDNEMAAGKYALKDMRSGEQETLGRAELVQRIK
jgi:histidyl-tRNA synthetase